YQWSAVVPAFAAPITMKFGRVTDPGPDRPRTMRAVTTGSSCGAAPRVLLSGCGRLADGLLDLTEDVAELPIRVDAVHDRPVEPEVGADRVAEPHVLLGLVLRPSRVASQGHVERGGEVEDKVGYRDVLVQVSFEHRQRAPNGKEAQWPGKVTELRTIRSSGGPRRISIAENHGAVR